MRSFRPARVLALLVLLLAWSCGPPPVLEHGGEVPPDVVDSRVDELMALAVESGPALRAAPAAGPDEVQLVRMVVMACLPHWSELLSVAGNPDVPGSDLDTVASACLGEPWPAFRWFLGRFGWNDLPVYGGNHGPGHWTYAGSFRLDGPGLAYTQNENGIPIAVTADGKRLIVRGDGLDAYDIPTSLVRTNDYRQAPRAALAVDGAVKGSTVKPVLGGFSGHRIGALALIEGRGWGGSFKFYNVAGEDLLGLWSFEMDLQTGTPKGGWRVGPKGGSMVGPKGGTLNKLFHGNKTHGGWLTQIDPEFADEFLGGRRGGAGRHREAGAFGGAQGPSLYAFHANADQVPNADLGGIPLMLYPTKSGTWTPYRYGNQYRGAWVWDGLGRGTVLIGATEGLMTLAEAQAAAAGGTGHNDGPNYYGPGPGCSACLEDKGWHAHPYEPRLYFVDPRHLAEVAAGTRQPWEVQPFASISPDWLWQLPGVDVDARALGQWFAGMAYHPPTGRLFISQGQCWPRSGNSFRTGAAVHVLQLTGGSVAEVPPGNSAPPDTTGGGTPPDSTLGLLLPGGLYADGDTIPGDHLARQPQISPGPFVMVSAGMSNTKHLFCDPATPSGPCASHTFVARAASVKNPELTILNGAQSSQDVSTWTSNAANNFGRIKQWVAGAGHSNADVQVMWAMHAKLRSPLPLRELADFVRASKAEFPNLSQLYLSSLHSTAGNGGANDEPFPYDAGFVVRDLVVAQIEQLRTGLVNQATGDLGLDVAPWLAWGPYWWDEIDGQPMATGLNWTIGDLAADRTHMTNAGERKLAGELLTFFSTSPATRDWFLP